ncbi:MAG: hypothetical protein ACXV2I_04995 [Actinomycetes bacterium]
MKRWRAMLRKLDGWTTWGGPRLPDEVDAFLQGQLLEQMRAVGAGGQVPPWMWLNAVAHGAQDVVELMAAGCPTKTTPVTSWRTARSRLARELLDRSGGDPAAMRVLQARVLVPLELRLPEVTDLTPARLTDIGVHELRLADA